MKIYLVGGAVRDKLLNLPVIDKDWLVVGATIQQMLNLGFKIVGKDFPVFLHPETHEEYALARTEKKIAKGYHGFKIFSDQNVTLEQDLMRRDLTINAIAMNKSGDIIDPYGGVNDLHHHCLRHVSKAFTEDPVRLLRIARFAAKFIDFDIATETLDLLKIMVTQGEIDHLNKERIWQEFHKSLKEVHPWRFFQILLDCNAANIIFPKINIQQAKDNLKELFFTNDALSNFILSFVHVNIKQLKTSCIIPKLYIKHLQCYQKLKKFMSFLKSDLQAEKILNLFLKTDAFRNKQRFLLLLNLYQKQYNSNNVIIIILKNILDACMTINIKNIIINQPVAEIPNVITKQRLIVIQQVIKKTDI